MSTCAPVLTTVMYHYVRPVAESAFPKLKALELHDFLGQLDHLQRHYDLISLADLSAALAGGAQLPARPCLLTFDDGYSDHYRHVYPALKARGLSGVFFAPKSSCVDRSMLEVNAIQFILAAHPAPETLADALDEMLVVQADLDPVQLRAAHFKPNRFDGAGVAYTKRLLQHVLPAAQRSTLIRTLFERYVSNDQQAFADDLYLTEDQAREMQAGGMSFGGHGDLHLWHDQASPDQLSREIEGSVAMLDHLKTAQHDRAYSYPFGGENADVRNETRQAGFTLGFTVEPRLWDPTGERMRISRLDTNDLPMRPTPDCPWLAKAKDGPFVQNEGPDAT